MSVEALREYISEFRGWLDEHGAPALQPEQASLVANWREELAAAERLLEAKPELPIAFLGPSQQGKSSLINALLGENILAVGGAVGACTCVITSVHYRATGGYRAEIDLISLDDWRAELVAMQEALHSPLSEDDTELDREEREASQKAAGEKFKAVYQDDAAKSTSEILEDRNLCLPADMADAMASGRAIIVEEENALTLRNKVRRYLVGREQYEDGQFWPLISRVRIYGRFDALSNGVVLVDLPGLNDPNPAREQITKKYLEEARYIWLVCNSQVGIDRVFTQLLRENGLFFRLFLEGRLGAFSVIATRIDDINLETILGQMGIVLEDFDGNHSAPLEFRRKQISTYVQKHLRAIAEDIVSRADASAHRELFLQRVRSIPVFSVSTAAYLHAVGQMPLYQGMRLSPEDTHVPHLIEHLDSITLEESYQTQVEASCRRLQILHEQVNGFFLDQIRRIEQDSEEARLEWDALAKVATGAIKEGETAVQHVQIRFEESLDQRCLAFEQRLVEFDARAALALKAIFASWESIHWRSLKAAVSRGGEWFSRATQREININRDVARAYLDLLPFVWEDFFGDHLSTLIADVASGTEAQLQTTAARLKGALDMIRHQPAGLRESMETSLRTAGESFQLQAGLVRAALTAQIQRTRQSLSSGMVETASSFMGPAYTDAGNDPGGPGIKRRLLAILMRYAEEHAPALFINMRQELAEGVTVLQASTKPQLSKIVGYGIGILDRFRQNICPQQSLTPELQERLQLAFRSLPTIDPSPQNMDPSSDQIVQLLIKREAGIHYRESPPAGVEPFVVIERDSSVLISAPHGTRAFRNNGKEEWHEEDEYTAGMALLLGERCGTSVIANIWRSDNCDPNFHPEDRCLYKQRLRQLVQRKRIQWVLDLHGADKNSPRLGVSCVDLGTRESRRSMDPRHRDKLRGLIQISFGENSVSIDEFPASTSGTITAYCQEVLGVQAIQLEMKPSVRVSLRRTDASSFPTQGEFSAPPENVGKMLGALTDFVRYLEGIRPEHSKL